MYHTENTRELLSNRLPTVLQNLTSALQDKGYNVESRTYGSVSGMITPPTGCHRINIDIAAVQQKGSYRSSRYQNQFRVSVSKGGTRIRRFPEPKRGFGDNVTNYLVDLFKSELRCNKVREEQNVNHATAAEWANELNKKHRLSGYGNVQVQAVRTSGEPKLQVTVNARVSKEEAEQLLTAFRRVSRARGCKSIAERS